MTSTGIAAPAPGQPGRHGAQRRPPDGDQPRPGAGDGAMTRLPSGAPRVDFPLPHRRARAVGDHRRGRPRPRPRRAGAVHHAGRAGQPSDVRLRAAAAGVRAQLRAARARRAAPPCRPRCTQWLGELIAVEQVRRGAPGVGAAGDGQLHDPGHPGVAGRAVPELAVTGVDTCPDGLRTEAVRDASDRQRHRLPGGAPGPAQARGPLPAPAARGDRRGPGRRDGHQAEQDPRGHRGRRPGPRHPRAGDLDLRRRSSR